MQRSYDFFIHIRLLAAKCNFALLTFSLPHLLLEKKMAKPQEVHSEFTHWDKSVPKLGLVEDLKYEYRVYALELAHDCFYVGIAHKSDVKRAVQRHFTSGGKAPHYTCVHPPKRVLVVWPAISTAVEAFVYYSFLSRMDAGATKAKLFRLGGWVQTSSKLSPVSALVQEEARRQLRSACFNCGSRDHYARDCKAPLNGCQYKCQAPGCGSSILITSRGQTPQAPPACPPCAEVSSSSSRRLPLAAAAPQPAKGRVASVAVVAGGDQPAKKRRVEAKASARGGKEISAMGDAYTSLSWYLCCSNPTPKQVRTAKRECSEHALELKGCHTRALDSAGFAATPPAKPKSLTGDRSRLGTSFVRTELESVQVRRNSEGEPGCRLSQVLFRVVDLRQAFGH